MADVGSFVLAEVMLWLVYVVAVVAVAVTAFSVVNTVRHRYQSQFVSHRIRQRLIAYGVSGFTAALLLLTFLLGSNQPILVNGINYAERFWLKITDMFITSSLVLIVIAACFVLFGVSGLNRKIKF